MEVEAALPERLVTTLTPVRVGKGAKVGSEVMTAAALTAGVSAGGGCGGGGGGGGGSGGCSRERLSPGIEAGGKETADGRGRRGG